MKRFFICFSLSIFTIVAFYVMITASSLSGTYNGRNTNIAEMQENNNNYNIEEPDGIAEVIVGENLSRTRALNVVNSILMDFRGYDTLAQAFMLTATISGAVIILKNREKNMMIGIEIKNDNIILENAALVIAPIIFVFGMYLLFHGHLISGGGFQGGTLAAASIIPIYCCFSCIKSINSFNMEFFRKNEIIGNFVFTFIALLGLFFFTNLFRNILFDMGNSGELFSSGTIFFFNLSMGYEVIMGIGVLLLLLSGLLIK